MTSPSAQDHSETETSMPPLCIDPTRAATLRANLASIQSRINAATSSSSPAARIPRLVAVSKLKPATDILALASNTEGSDVQPHRHFGENYVQELIEKSQLLWDEDTKVGRQIRWHFIGGLQSNKAKMLARDVRGLWCVESVDSEKKAKGLAGGWAERGWKRDAEQKGGVNEAQGDDGDMDKLRVMIQVNTSGEENKSGVEPNSQELLALAKCIREEEVCKQNLRLQGLMTIGALARSQAAKEGEENGDFVKLKEVREWLVEELGEEDGELKLSMGMSEDFESAVRLGSDEVRVGSTIFGERPPRSEAKVV